MDDDDFEKYENRLKTFENWPSHSPVFIKDLAEAGFCYTGKIDYVFCCRCQLTLGDWKEGEKPVERHKKENASCLYLVEREKLLKLGPKPYEQVRPFSNPVSSYTGLRDRETRVDYYTDANKAAFVTNYQSNNPGIIFGSNLELKIDDGKVETAPRTNLPQSKLKDKVDVPKIKIPTVRYNPTPQERIPAHASPSSQNIAQYSTRINDVAPRMISPNSASPNRAPRNISSSHSPIFAPQQRLMSADMANKVDRLHTFYTWPQDACIQPMELAEAGFYYLGTDDGVKCYKCNIALRNWDIDDTAWGEHQKWAPDCPLVREYQANSNAVRQIQGPQTSMPNQSPLSAASYALPVEGVFHQPSSTVEPITPQTAPILFQSSPVSTGNPQSYSMSSSAPSNEHFIEIQGGVHVIGSQNTIVSGGTRMQVQNHYELSPSPVPSQGRAESDFDLTRFLSERDISSLLDAGFTLETMIKVQKAGFEKYQTYFNSVEAVADAIMHFLDHGSLDAHSVHPTTQNQAPNQNPPNNDRKETNNPLSGPEEEKKDENVNLQREFDRIKEMQTCKICMDEQVGIVFLPCGHLMTCPECSKGLEQCPLCRATIQSSSRIYLS